MKGKRKESQAQSGGKKWKNIVKKMFSLHQSKISQILPPLKIMGNLETGGVKELTWKKEM